MAVHFVGVRHHSPACARLTEAVLRRVRPRHVLIEGPADMNARIDELLLGHELPIAVFTYYQGADRAHASWTPFCRHSPEWIALAVGKEVGARVAFMDLPAWHGAFAGLRNRYADDPDERWAWQKALCARFGVDDTDALWDHLFEQAQPLDELAERLGAYFAEVRGEQPGGERDGPREDHMLAWIRWAAADAERSGGDVVVVCGGFHAPALERGLRAGGPGGDPPATPVPEAGTRHGSYLVPYSWHRLDSFVGYESGLPSPAFYDALWAHGPEAMVERFLSRVAQRLRARRQPVSPADLIACATMAGGLARVRGHASPARVDLLDGIAAALLKDALDVPLPWSYRGTLLPGTDPLLVEVVVAFSGDRTGALAPGTPRPPLIADVAQELARHDLTMPVEGRAVELDLARPADLPRSRVLHRLAILHVPGVKRAAGPAWATDPELGERWELRGSLDSESAIIEASAFGATLEGAARARLEEDLLEARGHLGPLAALLGQAVFAGVLALAQDLVDAIAAQVRQEPSLGALGQAAGRLLALWRHDALWGAAGAPALAAVLEVAFDRGLWLLEGIQGAAAPADEDVVAAVRVLRDVARHGAGKLAIVETRARELMHRRLADPEAPPAIRGCALGFLWSLGDPGAGGEQAAASLRRSAQPRVLGDFLTGLFALAREEVVRAPGLVAIIDDCLAAFTRDEFLIALPALRLAFTYFPPAERERLALMLLERHGAAGAGAHTLVELPASVEEIARGLALDDEVSRLRARHGL
jgi:hypothetical protein